MSASKTIDTAAVTPIGRLLFPSLFKPRRAVINGKEVGDPEYNTLILFAPSEKEYEGLKRAAMAAAKKKWPGRTDWKGVHFPFRNGDTEAAKSNREDDVRKGMIVLKAKAKSVPVDRKPGIFDASDHPITDESRVYSGVWARLAVNFGAGNFNGDYVTAYLNFVRIIRDGDRIGGISVKDAFAGIVDEGSDLTVGANSGDALDDGIPF